ncbi:MAG: hypothetical protein ABSG91_16595 [Syntrophobacteraceae bacterium]|jgi:hypothetical protein
MDRDFRSDIDALNRVLVSDKGQPAKRASNPCSTACSTGPFLLQTFTSS